MKYAGNIGYAIQKKTGPGKWKDIIEERRYTGDVERFSRRTQSGDSINDNLLLDLRVSIISDPFANQNINAVRYVCYNDSRWKVTNIEVNIPRMILTLGGIYTGPTPEDNDE